MVLVLGDGGKEETLEALGALGGRGARDSRCGMDDKEYNEVLSTAW